MTHDPDHLIEAMGGPLLETSKLVTGLGITWPQLFLLVRLSLEARTMTQIAALAGITSGGVTNVADRLEHLGYVARKPDSDDRRKIYIAITEQGRAVIRQVRAALDLAILRPAIPCESEPETLNRQP